MPELKSVKLEDVSDDSRVLVEFYNDQLSILTFKDNKSIWVILNREQADQLSSYLQEVLK